jgi:hypothetical protein
MSRFGYVVLLSTVLIGGMSAQKSTAPSNNSPWNYNSSSNTVSSPSGSSVGIGTTCPSGAPVGSICSVAQLIAPVTVASLAAPSASNKNVIRVVSDGTSATDCTGGGGSSQALCISNGSAWKPLSGSGGGGGWPGYPSAGVAISTGSAWGTSVAVSSAPGANTIPETDGSGVLNVAAGFASTGAFKVSGATQSKPAAPAAGFQTGWFDATNLLLQGENNSGATVWTTVAPLASATAHKWLAYIDGTGKQQLTQPVCGDLSNSASSCATDTTNASNIASGILAAARVAPTPIPAPGISITLTAPRGYAICTGACTVSVPAPAAGYEFCVLNDDNVATAITLSALGSGAMYENTGRTAYGTAGTGTFTAAAAAGNKVCIVGRDSTHYLTVSYIGAWTAN